MQQSVQPLCKTQIRFYLTQEAWFQESTAWCTYKVSIQNADFLSAGDIFIGGHQVKRKLPYLVFRNFISLKNTMRKCIFFINIFISLKNAMKTIDTVALDYIYP